MTNREKLTALQAESFKAYQKFCAEHECGTCPYRTDDGYSCMDGFWVEFMLEHGVRVSRWVSFLEQLLRHAKRG